jgi:hypothetical protein
MTASFSVAPARPTEFNYDVLRYPSTTTNSAMWPRRSEEVQDLSPGRALDSPTTPGELKDNNQHLHFELAPTVDRGTKPTRVHNNSETTTAPPLFPKTIKIVRNQSFTK